ncbi:peptidase M4 family protein, partial [Streptomyces sp. Act-28]
MTAYHSPTRVFCTIVPPHLLDQLARSTDSFVAEAARRTLVADEANRTARRLTTVTGVRPAPRDVPA